MGPWPLASLPWSPIFEFFRWWSMLALVTAAPPKSPTMVSSSVGSDGTIKSGVVETANPNAESFFEGTPVVELDTPGWADVEARATSKMAFAVFFYVPGNAGCINAKPHFLDWVKRPEAYNVQNLKLKVVAVNCAREPKLCWDQGAQKFPHLTLYSPYETKDVSPEFFNGIYDAADMAEWARTKLHKLRDESNRREALKMIRRENYWAYDVGADNEKAACVIFAARNIAIMMAVDGLEEAAAQGLQDHPLKDLWGLSPDVNGAPASEISGNCAEVATMLREVMDGRGSKVDFALAYKKLVMRAFEMFDPVDAKKLRWQTEDPYSQLMIKEKVAPSLLGTKVLRLCHNIGDNAPQEIWAQCLTLEGKEVFTIPKKAKDEL